MNKPRLKHIQNWSELAQTAKWSAAMLAKNCGVSLRTLERHFLKKIGRPPKAWLAEQRQQLADKLNAGKSQNVKSVKRLGKARANFPQIYL